MAETAKAPPKRQATTGEAVEKAGNAVRMALRRMPEDADPKLVTTLKRISLDIAELVVGFQRAELDGS